MKNLNKYILEKLHINNTTKIEYIYHPKTKGELIACIMEKIENEGYGTKDNLLNLNDIDTSKITNMSNLFYGNDDYYELSNLSKNGYFDISDWDVSNVENMQNMFRVSKFDGDLSNWNVSKVKNMNSMFSYSKFTGKNGDISKWDVSNVKDMQWMFYGSEFNGDISDWNVRKVENMENMFYECPLQNNPPKWYKF